MKDQGFNCHIGWKTVLMKYCPHVCTLKFHNLRDKGKILKAPKMQQKDIHKEKCVQTTTCLLSSTGYRRK